MELDITELKWCGWSGTSPVAANTMTLWWWSSVILSPISKRFVSILYFEAFEKLLDGITDHYQQPNFLLHENIQDVFVNVCNKN